MGHPEKLVDITLKMWSDTRWESKAKSVEPLRYQAAAVREALIEVRDHTKDPVIKIEAQSLALFTQRLHIISGALVRQFSANGDSHRAKHLCRSAV